ncbi:MAG: hypothetical protein OIF57_08610 [Marinobacterium sp.]|nr:hypothetical protein [Marinobacterium sp.]
MHLSATPTTALLLLGAGSMIVNIANAAPATLRISSGYEYTEGDYGYSTATESADVETHQHSLPLSINWQQNSWSLTVSSYWLHTEGPAGVINVDGSPTNSGSDNLKRSKHRGFGDTTLRIKKELEWGAEKGVYFDLSTAVRLATASSDAGILHRSPDYTLQLDSFVPVGKWMPMLTVGHKWMGSGDNFTPDNVWLVSAGTQYQLNEKSSIGAIFDYRQRLTHQSEPLQELMSYVSYRMDKQWSLTGYLLNGFSDSSIDRGIGLQISWRQQQF